MTDKLREAARALIQYDEDTCGTGNHMDNFIEVLRAALSAPQQEPIADFREGVGVVWRPGAQVLVDMPLYASPPSAAQWLPIESAPKDGSEFLTSNANQGRVKRLVSWDRIHGCWQTKGMRILSMQDTHWMPIVVPQGDKP